jgi:copper(I)-binding protein
MELSVNPGTSDRLVAVKTDVAGRVELHNTAQEGGVMTMRRSEGIAVADKSPVVLQPGGSHVMLMDLKQPLKQGDTLKLTLVFEKAGELPIEATVEPVGAKGPQGMDHQPAASPGAAHKP